MAGHLIEPFIVGSTAVRAAYVLIYTFHIPALVFLSGYLSRTRPLRVTAARVAVTLLIPNVLLEVLYTSVDFGLTEPRQFTLSLLRPLWLLWYLPALAAWRLVPPALSRLMYPVLVAVSVSLLAGVIPQVGLELTASRIFVFLPAFVIGHRMASSRDVGMMMPRAVAWTILATGCVAAILVAQDINVRWLYGSHSYASLSARLLGGMAVRAMLLVWSLSMTFAFMTLVGGRSGVVARIGTVSMYPYVLHGIVVMIVVQWLPAQLPTYVVFAIGAASVPLSVLLSSARVVAMFRPLIQPDIRRLLTSLAGTRTSGPPIVRVRS